MDSKDGTQSESQIRSSELVRWQRAEKLLREAMADLEWFQKEWSTSDSLRTRINRVDWTIDNIKDFLKELPPNGEVCHGAAPLA